ncbi:MAG: helix-turn-helix domain-containing protein [Acidobacteriaceae bacterium]|jgi:DNA-binding HxlR family transcriptional regulator
MTKKEKKSKKAKKHEHLAISAESDTKHSPAEPRPAAKSSTKSDAKVDALVHEIIERIADKWTMVVLDVLAEHGTVRFTKLGKLAGGVSQKMLTKTVRQMESDGLVKRTVHPVVPPHVDYTLTDLGLSLGEAFCGVWVWAEKNYDAVEKSRGAFNHKPSA